MDFFSTIIEKENKYLVELEKCKQNGLKTFILGDGEGADNAEKRAASFCFSGRLVNKEYYQSKKGVFCLEDFLESENEKVNIVVAYRGFKVSSLDKWKNKIGLLVDFDCFAGNYAVDSELFTYEFLEENKKYLEEIYESLEDDFSREALSAYINQKISMDYKYLSRVVTKPQYFESLMPLSKNEVFVDCGAYDGDSACAFIEELRKRGIMDYKRIISFEPDPKNFEKLVKRNLKNHICINKGTSDKEAELHFSILGTSSGINEQGEIKVKTCTLDDEVIEPVSFIKMDIEGAELASLRGAQGLIRKYNPKLAVCIYHKKEDLWEIQNYLKKLVPEYKFYIRAYDTTTTELVLYAIC